MRFILAFAAVMALLTSHARGEPQKFVVENKAKTVKVCTFTVVNKCVPAVTTARRPFVRATSGQGTTVQTAGLKVVIPGSSGAISPGATITPAPLMRLDGGTTIGSSPCANGKCPTGPSVEFGIFGRKRR